MEYNPVATFAVVGVLLLLAVGMLGLTGLLHRRMVLDTRMRDDTCELVFLQAGTTYTLTVKRVTKPEDVANVSYAVYIVENDSHGSKRPMFSSGLQQRELEKAYTWTVTAEHGGEYLLWITNNIRCMVQTTTFQVTLEVEPS